MTVLHKLTQRDWQILAGLESYGLLTTGQLHRLFFKGIRKRTMLRRLRALLKLGFLRFHTGLPSGERIWVLSPSGGKCLGSDTILSSVNKNTLFHDVMVSDLRLKLESQKVGTRWQNGHTLKQEVLKTDRRAISQDSVVPDSLFVVKTKDGLKTIAFELELIFKAKSRYRNIFRKYADLKSIDLVWYVVPSQKFGERLLELVPKDPWPRSGDWLYWSLIDDVRQSFENLRLHGKSGGFLLNEFCKPEALKKPTAFGLGHQKFRKIGSQGAHLIADTVGTLNLDLSEDDSLSD